MNKLGLWNNANKHWDKRSLENTTKKLLKKLIDKKDKDFSIF